MKVFVVGSGCTWFERNNTSFIIDDKILFDTPMGSYKDVIKKINIFDLEGIIISHFHSDHFGDMQVFATRFMRESEKHGVTKKFKIFGPKGILDKLIALNKHFCAAADECDKESLQKHIDFIEVENGSKFEFLKYNVNVFEMDHGDTYCLGYTFTDESGKVVAFSADTKDCDNLRKMLDVSKVAFVDMAAPKPAKAHLDKFKFVELSKMYPHCKMYPVHTSDECQEFAINNNMNVLNDFDEIII